MNKVVLITGASRGIGASIAKYFAQNGYTVAVNCRNQNSALNSGEDVARACRKEGAAAKCYIADVTRYSECEKMVEEIYADFGQVDVLINNAGITKDGLIARMKEQDFDSVIDANLKSVFNMTKLVSTKMMRARKGAIVNLSSVIGVYGNAGQVNYAASKAGIIGITKSIAKELGGRGITCNAIAPGFVMSDMTDSLPEDLKKSMLDRISLKRFGTAEEIAQAALFLAEHKYITGQVLLVDGGMAV